MKISQKLLIIITFKVFIVETSSSVINSGIYNSIQLQLILIRKLEIENRIVHGRLAQKGEFPYQVI